MAPHTRRFGKDRTENRLRKVKRRHDLISGRSLRRTIQSVGQQQRPGRQLRDKRVICPAQTRHGAQRRGQCWRELSRIGEDVHGRSHRIVLMKAVAMFIVMVSDTFKMQEFVLLLIFMSHKRTEACKSQRLPAQAENQKRCAQTSQHVS